MSKTIKEAGQICQTGQKLFKMHSNAYVLYHFVL